MRRNYLWLFIASLSLFVFSCTETEKEPPCGTRLTKFTGTWNVTERCTIDEYGYRLTISEDSSGGLVLENFGDYGEDAVVSAIVEEDKFTIAPQLIEFYTIVGNGSLNAGCVQLVITWAGSPKGECTITGTR